MGDKPNPENTATEIIIAEDSPTQAEELKYLLEKHNFVIRIAGNGKEALELIRQHKPTIVISDIVMPQMDGYELCRRIKTDAELKEIPVVLLTALTNPQDIMRSLECGADNFVPKSCNADYLFDLIHYLIDNNKHESNTQTPTCMNVTFGGNEYNVTSSRIQIINLLLSTYEIAIQKNSELLAAQCELRELNNYLEQKVEDRTVALRREIEERKRAEKELKQLNAKLESRVTERTQELESNKSFLTSILNSTLDVILTIDEQGAIQSFNNRAFDLFGYDEHALPGMLLEDLLPEPFHSSFKTDFLAPIQNGRQETDKIHEIRAFKRNGEEFDCEISITKIDERKTISQSAFTAVMRDISERKKAEKADSDTKTQLIEQLECELHSLENLTSLVNTSTTAETLGVRPLHRAIPEIFDKAVDHYSSLLELSMEQRSHKVDYDIPDKLHSIAQELGYLKAGPRDIIEIHSMALRKKTLTANPIKTEAYAVEGRVMALEFMGHLVSYYRTRAIGVNAYKTDKNAATVEKANNERKNERISK